MESLLLYLLTIYSPLFWVFVLTILISIPCKSKLFFIGGGSLLWVSFFLSVSYLTVLSFIAGYLIIGVVYSVIQWRMYCARLTVFIDKYELHPVRLLDNKQLTILTKDWFSEVVLDSDAYRRHYSSDRSISSQEEYHLWLKEKLSLKSHASWLSDFILFWPASAISNFFEQLFIHFNKSLRFLYTPNKGLRELLKATEELKSKKSK